MAKQKIEPGMQVRVGRAHYHGIKFGAVCRVVADHLDGDVSVIGPVQWPGGRVGGCDVHMLRQAVCKSLCKPVKRKG